MAATLTEERRINLGESMCVCLGTITFDSSYPTDGEAIDAAGDYGYFKLFVEGGPISVQWDKANQKAKAFWGNAGTASLLPEVTNTTDLSAVTLDYVAFAIR